MGPLPELPREQLASFLDALHSDGQTPEIWLVFADWLEEQSDPRGELMRLQGEQLLVNEYDPQWQELVQREAAWWERHGHAWPGVVPKGVELQRAGVFFWLKMAAEQFRSGLPKHLDEALDVGWVSRLTLTFSTAQEAKRLTAGKGGKGLDSLTRLRELRLEGAYVTDAVLAQVKGLDRLETLDIQNTHLKGDALWHLRHLKSLAVLKLPPWRVFDVDVGNLCRLPQLRELDLTEARLTDYGLQLLTKFPALRTVNLTDNYQISDDGVRQFRQARPDLRIIVDG